jgi:hypothetical protein
VRESHQRIAAASVYNPIRFQFQNQSTNETLRHCDDKERRELENRNQFSFSVSSSSLKGGEKAINQSVNQSIHPSIQTSSLQSINHKRQSPRDDDDSDDEEERGGATRTHSLYTR